MTAQDHGARSIAAYVEATAQWRVMIIVLGFVGMVVIVSGTFLIKTSSDHNAVDFYTLAATGTVYLLCTVMSGFAAERHLYWILVVWVLSAILAAAGLSLNAYFGEHAHTLFEGKLPFIAPVVPAVTVFAHSYLAPRHALIMTVSFTSLMVVASLLFLALNWAAAIASIGAVFFVVTHVMLNPTVIGLMTVHHGTLNAATARLEQLTARHEREAKLQGRDQSSDSETQFLNLAGLIQVLADQLAVTEASEKTGPLTLAVEPSNIEQLNVLNSADQELIISRITRCLREELGTTALLARTERWAFFAVAADGNAGWSRDSLTQLHQRLSALAPVGKTSPRFHIGLGIARPDENPAFVLEEAHFQRYLAETRDLPWVVSPMLPEHLARAF